MGQGRRPGIDGRAGVGLDVGPEQDVGLALGWAWV